MAERKEEEPVKIQIPLECVENKEAGEDFVCGICHFICVEPIELGCPTHLEEPNIDIPLFCEQCFLSYLGSHENKCPIGNHETNVKYTPSSTRMKKMLAKLSVVCPNGDLFSSISLSPLSLVLFCVSVALYVVNIEYEVMVMIPLPLNYCWTLVP